MAQNSLLDLQEMKPTPRNQLIGLLADALTAGRDFADKAKVPAVVPLLGGQGLGSLLLGKAPEELTNISYGNMPLRINPLAGRTASFVPEIKPGRKESLADLVMAAQAVPGGNRAALGALGAVDTGANKAAIVWHGSPHKFDRFDSSKIGTGEGAQAYGHGIYVAESPGVADSYAKKLSGDSLTTSLTDRFKRLEVGGKPMKHDIDQMDELIDLAKAGDQNPIKKFLEGRRSRWNDYTTDQTYPFRDYAIKKRAAYDELLSELGNGKALEYPQGQLYKVDLPDNMIARMLDWDRPFSQQAPDVRKALQDAEVVGRDDWLISGMRGSEAYKRASFGAPSKLPLNQADDQIYAAERLRRAGIPGIRYLDGGSRGAGAGTSNFVVFPGEEQFLRILERNGGLLGP